MARANVKYQPKYRNNHAWSNGSTVVNLPDLSREAVKDYLLAHNPGWEDVRIVEIKPM